MLSQRLIAPPGIGASDGRGHQLKPGTSRGISKLGGDSGGTDGGGIGGRVGPLPPATVTMVPVWEDMKHGAVGEGSAVPDELHPGDILSSLQ